MDRAFRNEMDALINKTDDAFGRMMWREGLHSGFYAMQLLRDFYRCVGFSFYWHATTCERVGENLNSKPISSVPG